MYKHIRRILVKTKSLYFSILILLLFFSLSKVSATDYGTTGLITIPSARSMEDGSLKVSISKSRPADIYNITYQALPRVETTFRYTIFDPKDFGSDNLKDRSYALKINLLNEKRYLPQLAVGIRDILGTGAWAGEYFVANKRFGDIDFVLGLGWGRFGDVGGVTNPLTIFSDRFEERPKDSGDLSETGIARNQTFFRGEMGFFGGFSYDIPGKPYRIKMEYSSDSFEREKFYKSIEKRNPFSIGFEWEFIENSRLALSYQGGSYFGIRLETSVNTKFEPQSKPNDAFYSISSGRNEDPATSNIDVTAWYDRLLFDFERSGLKLNEARLKRGSKVAYLEIENSSYAYFADALNTALLLGEIHLPKQAEIIDFHLLENGTRGPTISYKRAQVSGDYEIQRRIPVEEIEERFEILAPRSLKEPTNRTDYKYPYGVLSADLAARVQLFDPDEPLRHQLYLSLSGRLLLTRSLNIWSKFSVNLANNFSTKRESNSQLPHVRSDSNLYLTDGDTGMDALYLEYKTTLSERLHQRSYLGILEEMYSGIGTEVLYHNFESRWAVGGTVSAVKKRGFQKYFNHLEYQTVTGFLSFYYASPIYDIDIAMHVGRYLAKDKGFTFEAKRSFDNGFEVGAFFTRTNVPKEVFGEGGFDKGLYFRIPFNSFLKQNTRSSFSTILRPLNRDGGRMLDDFGKTLWSERRSVRLDAIARNFKRIRL